MDHYKGKNPLRRAVGAILVLALILGLPGPGCYQALAAGPFARQTAIRFPIAGRGYSLPNPSRRAFSLSRSLPAFETAFAFTPSLNLSAARPTSVPLSEVSALIAEQSLSAGKAPLEQNAHVSGLLYDGTVPRQVGRGSFEVAGSFSDGGFALAKPGSSSPRKFSPVVDRPAVKASRLQSFFRKAGPLLLQASVFLLPFLAGLPFPLVLGAVCVTFQTLAEREAAGLAIRDSNLRTAAMKELENVLFAFGEQAQALAEAEDSALKTKVSAELVARSAEQGLAIAFDAYLAQLRRQPGLDEAAARKLFQDTILACLVKELGTVGLSGESEETIRKILQESGVLAKIDEWESRYRFVENLLKSVEEARASGKAASDQSVLERVKKAAEDAAGKKLFFLAFNRAFAWVFAQLGMTQLASSFAAKVEDTERARRMAKAKAQAQDFENFLQSLQLTLSDEENAMLRQVLKDLAARPARPLSGRSAELEKAIGVLSRPETLGRARSVLLSGPAGSGRRAIVEQLAHGIAEARYKGFPQTRVVELDLSQLIGAPIEGVARLMSRVLAQAGGRIILFVDGPELIKRPGAQELSHAFFHVLKPRIESGEVSVLVSGTPRDEQQFKAEGLPFDVVNVARPSIDDAVAMVSAHEAELAAQTGVTAAPGAFTAAVKLAARHLHDSALPGSALELLEKTFSANSENARWNRLKAEETVVIQRVVQETNLYKRLLAEGAPQPVQNKIYNGLVLALDRLFAVKAASEKTAFQTEAAKPVTAEDAARVVSELTGIPVSKIQQDESERLANLEEILRRRVVHQDHAVAALAQSVRRARAGLKDPKKPIGSFLFLGPTGVGKTELAKALASSLFDDEANMVRFDMSEFQQAHTVARLTGSPPGYVGHDAGGELTNAVKRRPYSVVLLDEVEKAHPDVLTVLLQVMDDGRLTDSKGDVVDFSNTVVIMTSNLGSKHIQDGIMAGTPDETIKADVMAAVGQHFRPEFLGRLNGTYLFNALGAAQAGKIAELHLVNKVDAWLKDNGLSLARPIDPEVLQLLVDKGFNPASGARSLLRAIESMVLDPLSAALLAERPDLSRGDWAVRLEREGDGVRSALELLPVKQVARMTPTSPEAADLLDALLPGAEPITIESLDKRLNGTPEDLVSRDALGIFKPMAEPRGGETMAELAAVSDDPDLKDASEQAATKDWPAKAGLADAAKTALVAWLKKAVRCAKATNHLRPKGHEPVRLRWARGEGFDEFSVRALPLSRKELLEAAKIFTDHYALDSLSKEQSRELANQLTQTAGYGRAELLEVKRLLSGVPGAEFGYWSTREELVFWARVPRAAAVPVEQIKKEEPQAEPVLTDAAAEFKTLTAGDAPELAAARSLIASLLDSSEPAFRFRGFKAARGILGQEAFKPLGRFIPPSRFLRPEIQKLYLEDPELGPFVRERDGTESTPGVSTEHDFLLRIETKIDYNRSRLDYAKALLREGKLSEEGQARLMTSLLDEPARRYHRARFWNPLFTYPHKIRAWLLWPSIPGFIVGLIAGVIGGVSRWAPWALILTLAGFSVSFVTILLSSLKDKVGKPTSERFEKFNEGAELMGTLLPLFGPERQARIVAALSRFIRNGYYRIRYHSFNWNRESSGKWQLTWADAVARHAALLPESARERLVRRLVSRAQSDIRRESRWGSSDGKHVKRYGVLTLFHLYDLLDESQKKAAWDMLFADFDNLFREGALKLDELIAQGKLPADRHERFFDSLSNIFQASQHMEPAQKRAFLAIVFRMAKGFEPAARAAVIERLWSVRGDFNNDPEFYRLFFKLTESSPRWAERILAEQLGAKYPNAPILDWLSDGILTEEQKDRVRAKVRQSVDSGQLEFVGLYLRDAGIPWKERLDLLSAQFAMKASSNWDLLRRFESLTPLLVSLYRERHPR